MALLPILVPGWHSLPTPGHQVLEGQKGKVSHQGSADFLLIKTLLKCFCGAESPQSMKWTCNTTWNPQSRPRPLWPALLAPRIRVLKTGCSLATFQSNSTAFSQDDVGVNPAARRVAIPGWGPSTSNCQWRLAPFSEGSWSESSHRPWKGTEVRVPG